MATETLTFKAEQYFCEPCSKKQGTLVKELVRMIPVSVVAFGKLIGDEYYCCPICFEPKFEVKGRKKVKDGARVKKSSGTAVSEDLRPGRGDAGAATPSLRVVGDSDSGSSD